MEAAWLHAVELPIVSVESPNPVSSLSGSRHGPLEQLRECDLSWMLSPCVNASPSGSVSIIRLAADDGLLARQGGA